MKKMNIGTRLNAWARGLLKDGDAPAAPALRFRPPDVLGVPKEAKVAMDAEMADVYAFANSSFGCHEYFPGYPALAQLTQIAEYRMLSEKTAEAMVRKWIKVKSKGDDDKSDLIKLIEDKLIDLKVRDLFCEAAKNDGFFGRAQIFVDLGEQQGAGLAIPLAMDGAVVKGKLRKLKLVEAMYTYPSQYSASNPLADDYYNPRAWLVMGQSVHASRLLTFVGRPVPDVLKPSYNFGGMSMSQLARPYVDNWIKTRNSVNKLISNFSTSGIKTDLSTVLAGDAGDDLLARVQLYNDMRDNQGTMLLDKEVEDFFQFNVPLSTIDKLQAQAQEHLASVSSMPLPVLTGVTPAGLNASAEGDIRIWYDHVHDRQRTLFGDHLTKVIDLVQLSEVGDIDPDITFDFVSLWEQDETELAANRKSDAETAGMYVEMGVIQPEEVREKLARDDHSGYNGLDLGVALPEREEDDDPKSADEEADRS